MSQESEFILVMTTCNNADDARSLAKIMVESGTAACVNISSPVTSIYQWKGNIETDEENILFIKSRRENFPKIQQVIQDNHSYEVPEIIALPIVEGESTYLNWLKDNSQGA